MSKNKPAETATNKPAHEIRINGIRATIWKNETEKGPRYNTTFERSYKDGEEWKTSDSYGREDLLLLAYMARKAFPWIPNHPTKKTPGAGGQTPPQPLFNMILAS